MYLYCFYRLLAFALVVKGAATVTVVVAPSYMKSEGEKYKTKLLNVLVVDSYSTEAGAHPVCLATI